MTSGWKIEDVELEFAPDTDERNITRTFQSETLFNFFPALTKSSARAFDYTFKGIITFAEAFALDQISKSADTNTIVIVVPANDNFFAPSEYAVKSFVINRKGPLFTEFGGGFLKVLPYTLTLTELPDEGEVQEGVDAFTDADEGAIGTQQINEIIEETGTELPVEDFGPVGLWNAVISPIAGPFMI